MDELDFCGSAPGDAANGDKAIPIFNITVLAIEITV
jgi:hypothetical protein